MPKDLHFSQNASSPVHAPTFASSTRAQETRAAIVKALRTDDLTAIKKYAQNGEMYGDDLYDNNQNCLHIALESGSHSVAMAIIEWWRQDDSSDLLNARDGRGYTPIMYAAESEQDNPELIDAMTQAGADQGLSDALLLAAERGHIQSAQRLKNAGANPSEVLLQVLRGAAVPTTAIQVLLFLDVNLQDAFERAVNDGDSDTAKALLYLGADSTQMLISAIKNRDEKRFGVLVNAGANPTVAAGLLACDGDADSLKFLHDVAPSGWGESMNAARYSLVDHADAADAKVFCDSFFTHSWEFIQQTAKSGDIATQRALLSDPISSANREMESLLERFAYDKHLTGIVTLIAAGAPTQKLMTDWANHERKSKHSLIDCLAAAGADTSSLPASALDNYQAKVAAIANLSQAEKNEALLTAAQMRKPLTVKILLNHDADLIAAIQALKDDRDAMDTLRKSGLDVADTLTRLIQAGHLQAAYALRPSFEIAYRVLLSFIEQGDMDSAKACFSIRDTGLTALSNAARNNDKPLVKALLSLGDNGAEGVRYEIDNNCPEAAKILVDAEANVHKELYDFVRRGHPRLEPERYAARLAALRLLGADYTAALNHAANIGDVETARKLIDAGADSVAAETQAIHNQNTDAIKVIIAARKRPDTY